MLSSPQQVLSKRTIISFMKILVVEDERKISAAIKKGLEQEGFLVDVAEDGRSGYDLAASEEYDLILLDLMLPIMSGHDICKKLRSSGIHTPVLMLTALGELEDKLTGFEDGADDYLTKPFAFEELVVRIRALLKRPHFISEKILKCGTLELNTETMDVMRAEKHVSLSKREYQLLEYLMRNKNKTLSKEQIISSVWNYDSDVLDNTVEQYISYLRVKLDKNFPKEEKLLHTVRGFGYILRCDLAEQSAEKATYV